MGTQSVWRAGGGLIGLILGGWAAGSPAQNYLPLAGGPGGSPFVDICPAGQNLLGFDLRVGDDIDAIRPICAFSYGPTDTSPLPPEPSESPNGWHGGPGGGFERVVCPPRTPIVYDMWVHSEGDDTPVVRDIEVICGQAVSSQSADLSTRIYGGGGLNLTPDNYATRRMKCPDGQVAVGLHGRTGMWVDAIGLICDSPRFDSSRVRSVGRSRTGALPTMDVCDAAQSARQRNSPAAAGLEEKCANESAVRPIGRIVQGDQTFPTIPICEAARVARARNSPAAGGLEQQCADVGAVRPTPRVAGTASSRPPIPICDAAAQARDRNSPAAAGLRDRCLALGGQLPDPPLPPVLPAPAAAPDPQQLALKGAMIARRDPLSAELRSQQPGGPIRFGFDVAMGAVEGQTEWGPGKEALMQSLGAAEQEGFKTAISFLLDRNRNAALAASGAAIARRDPALARSRRYEDDVRYWLGFDIASGLFGPTRLGGAGHTAEGPGSNAIRDGLGVIAQRGYRAAAALLLSQRY